MATFVFSVFQVLNKLSDSSGDWKELACLPSPLRKHHAKSVSSDRGRCRRCPARYCVVLYCTLQVCELMVTVITAQAPRALNLSEARDLTSSVANGPFPSEKVMRVTKMPYSALKSIIFQSLPWTIRGDLLPLQIALACTATERILHIPVSYTSEMSEGPSHRAGHLQ